MRKLTQASLFTGIGGADLGYRNAGLEHAWGVEWDHKIAEVANANFGGSVRCMNILDANPMHFEKVDVLHASPVCKAFSAANANKGEAQLDIDCARKVAEFIQVLQPQYFTLENVEAYRKSKSFNLIIEKLYSLGYWVRSEVLNSADFAVPQSRRRLILIAVKDGFIPSLPAKEKHIGWYEAIADKVHDLPDSKLADWQLKALPDEIKESLLLSGTYVSHGNKIPDMRTPGIPCFTQTTTMDKHPTRAILIENTGARSDRELQTRAANEPCWTVRSMGQDGHWHRANALLVHPTEQRTPKPYKYVDEPCHTILANHGGDNIKALLENARIVALDIACLARLQSFPDDFIWSGVKSVDGKGIGNSCCPLKIEKIARSFINQ